MLETRMCSVNVIPCQTLPHSASTWKWPTIKPSHYPNTIGNKGQQQHKYADCLTDLLTHQMQSQSTKGWVRLLTQRTTFLEKLTFHYTTPQSLLGYQWSLKPLPDNDFDYQCYFPSQVTYSYNLNYCVIHFETFCVRETYFHKVVLVCHPQPNHRTKPHAISPSCLIFHSTATTHQKMVPTPANLCLWMHGCELVILRSLLLYRTFCIYRQ